MIDSMLSQLANIDQDTNLPVNSYDIDLPTWLTMDHGDPFADVELGSDLSNLRDRFFPDTANQFKKNGGANGGGDRSGNGAKGSEAKGKREKKDRSSGVNGVNGGGGKKNGAANGGGDRSG